MFHFIIKSKWNFHFVTRSDLHSVVASWRQCGYCTRENWRRGSKTNFVFCFWDNLDFLSLEGVKMCLIIIRLSLVFHKLSNFLFLEHDSHIDGNWQLDFVTAIISLICYFIFALIFLNFKHFSHLHFFFFSIHIVLHLISLSRFLICAEQTFFIP